VSFGGEWLKTGQNTFIVGSLENHAFRHSINHFSADILYIGPVLCTMFTCSGDSASHSQNHHRFSVLERGKKMTTKWYI